MKRSNDIKQLEPQTPALVIDQPVLEQFVCRFEEALATYWPNSVLSYSFKTNSLPWLVSYMRSRGVWAEVVSDTEYELALALGYEPDRIVYNGPIKGRDRLRTALRQGSVVNLDAKREVTWAAQLAREMPEVEISVGLRVNWDLNAHCPGESTAGSGDSRFGFNSENGELDAAIGELSEAGVRIAGLHTHRNSFTQSLGVFRAGASVAAEIISSRGLELDWIDIGGGFFGSEHGSPTFGDYISVVRESLDGVIDPDRTKLIVEPGGSLVAVPLEFHAKVIDIKDVHDSRFVVTDASRTNIDPLFRRRRPFDYRLVSDSAETHPEQTISGFTCMEDDRLMQITDEPVLNEGDRVVFYKVGGYTMCYQSMLFIEFPPAVYVRTEDELILVRPRPSVTDYLRGNSWLQEDEIVGSDSPFRAGTRALAAVVAPIA